jgi:hypothetical protein
MDLLSRVLRPQRRGTLFVFQGSLGGLSGILGGLALASLMARLDYHVGFVSAWGIGILLTLGGGVLLLRLRQLPGLRLRRRAAAPGMPRPSPLS